MLGTATFLAFYYLGFGFVAFLGWACVTDSSGRALGPAGTTRLHRLAVGLAVAGLLHPALALAGRDLAIQLRDAAGPPDRRASRTVRLTGWATVVAFALATLVVLGQLGQLWSIEAVPGLGPIGAALGHGRRGA